VAACLLHAPPPLAEREPTCRENRPGNKVVGIGFLPFSIPRRQWPAKHLKTQQSSRFWVFFLFQIYFSFIFLDMSSFSAFSLLCLFFFCRWQIWWLLSSVAAEAAVEMWVVVWLEGKEEMAPTAEEGDHGSVGTVAGEGLLLICWRRCRSVMEKKLKRPTRGKSEGVWLCPLLVLASWFRRKGKWGLVFVVCWEAERGVVAGEEGKVRRSGDSEKEVSSPGDGRLLCLEKMPKIQKPKAWFL